MKFLEEYVEVNLCDFGVSKDYLYIIPMHDQ